MADEQNTELLQDIRSSASGAEHAEGKARQNDVPLAGCPRWLNRRTLAMLLLLFALAAMANTCEDDDGNPIPHDHCWDGTAAAVGGCPTEPTPEPTPEPLPPCPYLSHRDTPSGSCHSLMTQCTIGTFVLHDDPCPTPAPDDPDEDDPDEDDPDEDDSDDPEENDPDVDPIGWAESPPAITCNNLHWPAGTSCVAGSTPTTDEQGIITYVIDYDEIPCQSQSATWPDCLGSDYEGGTGTVGDVDCTTWTPADHGDHSHTWYPHDGDGNGEYDTCTYPHECGTTANVHNCEETPTPNPTPTPTSNPTSNPTPDPTPDPTPTATPVPGVPTGLTVTCFGWQEPAGDYGDGYYTVFVSWDAQSGAGVVFELVGDLGYVGADAMHTGVVAAVVVADPDDEDLEVLAPVTVGVRVRATSAGVTSAYTALAQDTCSPPPCPAAVPAAVAAEARARYGDLRWEGWLGAYDGTQAQIAQSAVPGGDQTLLPASLLSVIDGVPDSVVWLTEHGRDNAAPGVSWQSARDPESGCSWRLDEINVALRELLFTDAADLALADTESGGQWDYWAQAVDIWDDTSAQQQQYWAVWHDRGAYGGDGVPAGYGLPARCETSRGPTSDGRDDCDISARCRASDVPEATFRSTLERARRPDPPPGCVWVVPREGYWEWWIEWELVPERDENCDQPDAACWVQIGRGMSRFLKLTGPAGLIELNQPDDP